MNWQQQVGLLDELGSAQLGCTCSVLPNRRIDLKVVVLLGGSSPCQVVVRWQVPFLFAN